jgi:hypothetical protein
METGATRSKMMLLQTLAAAITKAMVVASSKQAKYHDRSATLLVAAWATVEVAASRTKTRTAVEVQLQPLVM